MLKPIIDAFRNSVVYPVEAARRLERRKNVRGHADFMFEAHRDICLKCDGKSFDKIKNPEHPCDEGFRLAMKATMAHRALRGK